MNLLQIRTSFVKLSGRYDLVEDAVDFVDNGANFYINAGIHLLEKLANVPECRARLFFELAVDAYSLTFQHKCRFIKEVWANNSEERFELTKVPFNVFRTYFADTASDTESGTPYYYTLAELRALETTDRDDLATFIDKTWDEDDTNYNYRGILIAPPADKVHTIEIFGVFKQADLSADGDENFWVIEEADLVLQAALYKLETLSRGTENTKNWIDAIRISASEIDKDVVEEEIQGLSQMEG